MYSLSEWNETKVFFDYEGRAGANTMYAYPVFLMRRFSEAKTYGDLRRVYEMIPKEYWFLPARVEEAPLPAFEAPDNRTHGVADARQLQDAIKKAKNGDTTVVLRDIRANGFEFTVKNKSLTVRGLEGAHLKIYLDMEADEYAPYPYWHSLFYLYDATVAFENLAISTDYKASAVLMRRG